MTIKSVSVTSLRNHAHTELSCASQVTILSGKNGAGKTSILEGVYLCAIGRSFVPVNDSALIRHADPATNVKVHATSDIDTPYNVSVTIRGGVRKRIETSFGSSLTPRDIIGELPVVALSPDHKSITFGSPSERRSFIDAVMAQCSRHYTDLLYEHRRVLKQRNALLADAQGRSAAIGLDVWTDAFVKVSAEIVRKREEFIATLTPIVCGLYSDIAGNAETISIEYQPDTQHDQFECIAASVLQRELQRGTTMFGPQKDEIVFRINGGVVKETASQGQHKSLLVALKLAECKMLSEVRNERPVVLLDDVFSELDAFRCQHVMEMVLGMKMQCLVTTTEGDAIKRMVPAGADAVVVIFDDGHIVMKDAA